MTTMYIALISAQDEIGVIDPASNNLVAMSKEDLLKNIEVFYDKVHNTEGWATFKEWFSETPSRNCLFESPDWIEIPIAITISSPPA